MVTMGNAQADMYGKHEAQGEPRTKVRDIPQGVQPSKSYGVLDARYTAASGYPLYTQNSGL